MKNNRKKQNHDPRIKDMLRRIRTRREDLELGTIAAAQMMNTTHCNISTIENSYSKLTLDYVFEFAKAYGVSAKWIIFGED